MNWRQEPVELSTVLQIRVRYDKEASVYVSHCPLFDLYSQGGTEVEAREAIIDAIKTWFAVCESGKLVMRSLSSR